MKSKQHTYRASIEWTGNLGQGTTRYDAYSRAHRIVVDGKPEIPGSSDPAFRGDPSRYNPEEMLVVSLSACHLLWYLHLCAQAGVVVTDYVDQAQGLMEETPDGGGRFVDVTLFPTVTVTDQSMQAEALRLHGAAHKKCFIANSVNFPVRHQPTILVKPVAVTR